METARIEKWVDDLLTVAVVAEDGEERNVYHCLRHLFTAVKIFDQMTVEEHQKVDKVIKLTKSMFYSKFSLKETKRKAKKQKGLTPTPPSKEKENPKEKSEKTHTHEKEILQSNFEEREAAFKEACMAFKGQYGDSLVIDFFNYYSLPNKSKSKMRFEKTAYFDIGKMLARWAENKVTSEKDIVSTRLLQVKAKETKESKVVEKQQVVATIREEANRRREEELEESKANSVTLDEYLESNPNSILARFKK